MLNEPHKPEPQTKEDRNWSTGIWNPRLCRRCGRRVDHPIHQQKYRNNHFLYALEHPNKKRKT